MSVKRFIGEDAHSAMQQVRKAFGDDAVIVANREVASGVEILAANSFDDLLDPDKVEDAVPIDESSQDEPADIEAADPTTGNPDAAIKKAAKQPATSGGKKRQPAKSDKPATARKTREVVASSPVASSNEFQKEILELRSIIEGLARSGSVTTTKNISQIGLSGRLLSAGLGTERVRDLMEAVSSIKKTENAWKKITGILEKQLPLQPLDICAEGGIFFFHGPAGAGKTTALCKIAAQYLARESAAKLAIINCDTQLIGNSGLLPAVGSLLGVPIHNVSNETDLSHSIRQLRRKHLILIDTSALTSESMQYPDELTGARHSSRRAKHCLVLPAHLQGSAIDGIFSSLSESVIQSLILTRVDETPQLGISIDCLLRSSMKLTLLSDSPSLHDPLRAVNASNLIEETFKAQNVVLPTIINKMPGNSKTGGAISEDSLSTIPFG